jgi:hypothetical protein
MISTESGELTELAKQTICNQASQLYPRLGVKSRMEAVTWTRITAGKNERISRFS